MAAGDATGTVAGHTACTVAAAGHIVCTVAVAGHHIGRTVVAVVGHHIGRTVAAVAAAHIVHTVDCLRLCVEHHNKAVAAGRIECIVAAVGRTA